MFNLYNNKKIQKLLLSIFLSILLISCSDKENTTEQDTKNISIKTNKKVELIDKDIEFKNYFPRFENSDLINNEKLLDLLNDEAIKDSDALIILKDKKVLVEKYFDNIPKSILFLETDSITKVFSSLAIMNLYDKGKIKSFDKPIHHWIPEWNKGKKKKVTLRHLLTHTSGIGCNSEVDENEYWTGNFEDHGKKARNQKVINEPGTQFCYLNIPIQLLSEIVKKITNKNLEEYISTEIFNKLGIENWDWAKNEKGDSLAFAGLSLHPRDLVKIGQFMLNKGKWNDEQIVSEKTVDLFTSKQFKGNTKELIYDGFSGTGLGFIWLIYENDSYTFSENQLNELKKLEFNNWEKLSDIKNKTFNTYMNLWSEIAKRLNDDELNTFRKLIFENDFKEYEYNNGKQIGFGHSGIYGQYLMIFPDKNIIIVRMKRKEPSIYVKGDFRLTIGKIKELISTIK